MIRTLRLIFSLSGIILLTLGLAPVQIIALKFNIRPLARYLPVYYHRALLRLIGVKVHVHGAFNPNVPTLLVSNHVSWIDIVAIGSMAPLAFIAKSEIASWPVFGWLAKLQRTVFADRTRKTDTKRIGATMEERFAANETLVLFAEGTTGTGARVLPFKSALIGAALKASGANIAIQAMSVHYPRWHGLPVGHYERPFLTWYGDMDMVSHVGHLLKEGGVEMHITIHEPAPAALVEDRKKLTSELQRNVRESLLVE